jgi:hypothetical protein
LIEYYGIGNNTSYLATIFLGKGFWDIIDLDTTGMFLEKRVMDSFVLPTIGHYGLEYANVGLQS